MDSDVQPSRFLGPFKALAFRDFRLLWFGHAFQAGTWWAELVTRSVIAYELTGSALHLGALEFVATIGGVGLGMVGGVWADRVNRRTLLLAMQVWTLAVYAALAGLALTHNLVIWHLYAGMIGLAIGEAANHPVRSAAIPSLVPPQYVMPALTLGSMAVNAMRIVVPLTAGGLIQITGEAGFGFLLCLLLYVAILWCTWRLRLPDMPQPPERSSPLRSMAEGLRYTRRNRNVLAMLTLSIGPLGFGFSYQAILIVYAIAVLGGGQGEFAGLIAAVGIGAVAGGSVIASRTTASRNGALALASATSYGMMLVGLGLVGLLPSGINLFWVAVPLAVVLGASNTAFRASANASLLLNTLPAMRGRVMGMTLLPEVVLAFGALAAGAVAETVGAGFAMGALGIACMLVVGAVLLWRPHVRTL